jgi:hypothetical protein
MRIRNVLDQAELNGAGFPTDAIDLVTRIIPLGGAAQVPILLEQFLGQNPPWEGELRAAGKQGGARTRVASVLAAGDVGEALSLAERLPELAAWREPLTKAVDESGPSALASAELRRNAEAEAPLETLVATAFRHHAADALARSELRDPPIATGVDLMPKRNVQRLKDAIKDASSKLNDETDRLERAGTDRMRSEMGQVDRWIDESVVCRDLRAVEARLQRLEDLVETTEVSQ